VNNAFGSGDSDRNLYQSEHIDFVLTPHSVCSRGIVLPFDDSKSTKLDESSFYRGNSLQESPRPKSSKCSKFMFRARENLPFEQNDEAYMSAVAYHSLLWLNLHRSPATEAFA